MYKHKDRRIGCSVCGKTWVFVLRAAGMFIEVKENDRGVQRCLWCDWFCRTVAAEVDSEVRRDE